MTTKAEKDILRSCCKNGDIVCDKKNAFQDPGQKVHTACNWVLNVCSCSVGQSLTKSCPSFLLQLNGDRDFLLVSVVNLLERSLQEECPHIRTDV